jgi:hypothetical protein
VFRHTCATYVLERCRDLRVVQELLGHVSISTTAIYTHMDFEYLARVYRAAHPRAARKTICHIWAKRSDVAMPWISSSWLADAANGEWDGPPAVQLQLFRLPGQFDAVPGSAPIALENQHVRSLHRGIMRITALWYVIGSPLVRIAHTE